MNKYQYIRNFERLGFGMFVHFGLYSILGRGEWSLHVCPDIRKEDYEALPARFAPIRDWATKLARTAKEAGCKYITLTTRHHDGFALFDTCGLTQYDAPHSAAGRDLVAEFVHACRAEGIVPFLYHTLLDWHHPAYQTDFSAYIDDLIASVEVLCTHYGKIGGLWFDGMWDRPDADWQTDRLYRTIRTHQKEAMIINNTGMVDRGGLGHFEIDSVTYERGRPKRTDFPDGKPRAGEMCQVLNDHWGYAAGDCNYKSVGELLGGLLDCRACGCNFLLNTGLSGDGTMPPMDQALFRQLGTFIRATGDFIYDAREEREINVLSKNADLLRGEHCHYIVVRNIGMASNPNVALKTGKHIVRLSRPIRKATLVDCGIELPITDGTINIPPYPYGQSLNARVVRIEF